MTIDPAEVIEGVSREFAGRPQDRLDGLAAEETGGSPNHDHRRQAAAGQFEVAGVGADPGQVGADVPVARRQTLGAQVAGDGPAQFATAGQGVAQVEVERGVVHAE